MKAEDLLENYKFKAGEHIGNSDYDLMCKFAIEFAKLHVKKALEEASENAITTYDHIYNVLEVDKNSILNAYSLELIK